MEKTTLTINRMVQIKRSSLLNSEATCVDCGTLFKVNIEEMGKYKDKKIPLPTRCKSCRRYKLIEGKLKRLTKLTFKILESVSKKRYESKLQKKQGKREPIKAQA